MEQADNFSKHITTIQIPMWLAVKIKQAGMTYTGALIAGWDAIEERKRANQELSDLRANLRALESKYQKLAAEHFGWEKAQ